MFGSRLESIIERKGKALSIFEKAKAKLGQVVEELNQEITAANGRNQELNRQITDNNCLIVQARREIDLTTKTINNIDQILGK